MTRHVICGGVRSNPGLLLGSSGMVNLRRDVRPLGKGVAIAGLRKVKLLVAFVRSKHRAEID